jgi:two-component sensor histidine kinase
LPPALTELAIGIVVPVAMVAIRLLFMPLAGDRAPYSLMFIGVVIATVLAGWRSGLIALVLGQLLAWYAILEPHWSFALPDPEVRGGLIIATLAQLVTLIIVALYQREVDKGAAEREQRLSLLDEALKEIDHRTRNNYQTVLALVDLQARRSTDKKVEAALRQVADRIQAVANPTQQLALRTDGLDAVRLDDHLCGLVNQIERGLSREEISVECEIDDVIASADAATSISIIVNELVTNALKHAFNGERSGRVQVLGRAGRKFELVVADDGRGLQATRRKDHSGLGSKLVESFARQLDADHEVVSTDKGTTHRLVIPRLS